MNYGLSALMALILWQSLYGDVAVGWLVAISLWFFVGPAAYKRGTKQPNGRWYVAAYLIGTAAILTAMVYLG